jgi:hypothetical protein
MGINVRIQNDRAWQFPRRIAGVAMSALCAASIAASMGWIANSNGASDHTEAVNVASAQPGGVNAAADWMRSPNQNGRGTCGGCGVVESMREIADPGTAGNTVRCSARANSVERIAGSNQDEQDVDVATLVAWHLHTRIGVGCDDEGPPAPPHRKDSTIHYEVIVLFRDGSRRVIQDVVYESRVPTWRHGDRVKLLTDVIS